VATLCRKRGLTVYGTGMHHDPLISSRAKPLTSWGHDWVVVTLIVRHPWWAPAKVWSLGIAFRLYRNRQGVTKAKKPKTQRRRNRNATPITAPGKSRLPCHRATVVPPYWPVYNRSRVGSRTLSKIEENEHGQNLAWVQIADRVALLVLHPRPMATEGYL
jgi:hypothetical protein